MEQQFAGKVGIVTGAGRGIGQAIALELARQGMSIGLVARSEAQLAEVQSQIEAAGGSAIALPADVTNRAAVEAVVKQVIERYGGLDVLVNNAGAQTAVGPVGMDDPDQWWYDVTVNLYGPYLFCHAAIPQLRSGGTIVNVSSGAGTNPFPNSSAYGASKAALIHFSETLAQELAPRQIAVFSLRPGVVDTELTRTMLAMPAAQQYLPHVAALFKADSNMVVPPEQAAVLVRRLCSPEASVLSGRMLSVYDDLDSVIREVERVRAENRFVLRLRTMA